MSAWREDLLERVERWGHDPIAASTLQPGLSYVEDGEGFVAYGTRRSFNGAAYTFSLGPPVASAAQRPALWERFLQAHPRPVATYLLEEDADHVATPDALKVPIGVEHFLALGPDHAALDDRKVKSARKQARKHSIELVELTRAALDEATRTKLADINASWCRRSPTSSEMHFLNRPLGQGFDPGRLFALTQGGDAFGFITLDPYRTADGRGYMLNLVRFEPVRAWGVYLFVVAELLERLTEEHDAAELSLGFSPFMDVAEQLGDLPPPVQRRLKWCADNRERIYPFAGLDAAKLLFGGERRTRYVVTREHSVAPIVWSLFRLSRVSLWGLTRMGLGKKAPRHRPNRTGGARPARPNGADAKQAGDESKGSSSRGASLKGSS